MHLRSLSIYGNKFMCYNLHESIVSIVLELVPVRKTLRNLNILFFYCTCFDFITHHNMWR